MGGKIDSGVVGTKSWEKEPERYGVRCGTVDCARSLSGGSFGGHRGKPRDVALPADSKVI